MGHLRPYNIDDYTARFLYDGSVVQAAGATIYDGIVTFAPAGTYLNVVQNGKVTTPNFWTTALNADAAQGISHRFMVKVRTGGADIDGRKLIGWTKEFGFTYSEFRINGTSRGNNVFALTYATDLNNATLIDTVKGWTDIGNTTEGYKLLDVDGTPPTEAYYSEWNAHGSGAKTINQFYERMKWLSKRAVAEDLNADTGTDYEVGDGTTTGRGQSFSGGSTAQVVTRIHFRLKKVGAPTGNAVAKVYTHSGTFGTSSVPNAAQATSVNVDVSKLSTSYADIEFGFNTQFLMTATTKYVVTLEYSGGDASNYVKVEGKAAGTHAGNLSSNAGGWTATAGADLWFKAFVSPRLYGLNGEVFRGITHQVAIGSPTGTFAAFEFVDWSGGTGQMLAIDSATAGTKMWIQLLTGAAPTDTQVITATGGSSAAATASGTATERTLTYPFIGQSTGSAIIGAYGVGIETLDLTASDKLFDLSNTQRTPPNNVTFTVLGLISGEDRVLVGPESGGTIDLAQFVLLTTLNGVGETAVVITTAIPTDTPAPTGTIRIELDSGIYRRVAYTSYTGSTFTIDPTDFTGVNVATGGNDVSVSYVDKVATAATASFTVVYSGSDRPLFVRVRDGVTSADGPIKTFETTATLGSAGGSATAIRTPDA